MSSLDTHRRILPAVPLDEAAIRQLEIWLMDLLSVRSKAAATGWRFNIQNLGANEPGGQGWAYLITNDSTDIGYGELGIVFYDLSGQGVFIGSEDVGVAQSATLTLFPAEAGLTAQDTSAFPVTRIVGISLTAVAGEIIGTLAEDGAFVLKDHNTDEILRKDENDADLHLPAGGNIIFDL